MRRLLVLRPEPGASRTAARAGALGFAVIKAPLFTIVPLAWEAPEAARHDALLLTSANAVREAGAALARYRALPTFAVGEATAEAAQAAGLDVRGVGASDAGALLATIAEAGYRAPLHLAGREHRLPAHPPIEPTTRIVYAAEAVATLPDAARDGGAVALLHSPRAATLFRRLVIEAGFDPATIAIVALSPAVAAAAGSGWEAAAAAASPDDAALLAAAARLCEDGARRYGGARA